MQTQDFRPQTHVQQHRSNLRGRAQGSGEVNLVIVEANLIPVKILFRSTKFNGDAWDKRNKPSRKIVFEFLESLVDLLHSRHRHAAGTQKQIVLRGSPALAKRAGSLCVGKGDPPDPLRFQPGESWLGLYV